MKVLFLTPWYPDEKVKNHGVFVREQANAIAARHEVVVISAKIDYENFGLSSHTLTKSEFGNLKEYRLVIKRSLPFYNQLNYFLICRRISVEVAKSLNPDVIHGNIGYPGAFWSWLVSRKIHKPFVITEHTFIYNNFRSFFHKTLTLLALVRAATVIAVSKKSAEEIGKHSRAKVTVIPNIVDASRFSIHPYQPGAVNIGFAGGLSSPNHVKGLDVLLRVMSKIKTNFVLHIAGDGPLREEYQSVANQLGVLEKCKFYGFVNYNEMPAFMERLHFFVNASRFESFGIAIIEAMSSGLPVICFDNGGPGDFVNDTNGILVENQNEEKLREAIERMMLTYLAFKREKIRESVLLKFSKDKFVNSIESVYSSAVGQYLIKQLP